MSQQGKNADVIKSPPLCSWVFLTVGFIAFVCNVWLSHRHLLPTTPDANIAFQDWFRHQGGWISPNLSLISSIEFHGNGLVVSGGGLREGDVLLEIPMDMLLTKDKAILKFPAWIQDTISQTIQDPLDQQDVWIAMDLMSECAKGSDSLWFPYIQVLPSHVPRLATFSDQELKLLQDDDDMAKYGASQRHLLHQIWIGGVQSALLQQDNQKNVAPADIRNRDACWTESSFHRFVALSSSRAMILENDIKYLSPMAEMINHADRPEVTTKTPTNVFQANHKRENGKLVVYADRDFQTGDMVVEEYGQLDNSLYITAFGFIPVNNPHHCVLLPLPNPMDGAMCVDREGRMDENAASILAAQVSNPNDMHATRKLAAAAHVKRVAQTKLVTSPTDLADDEGLLKNLEETTAQGDEWRGMNRDRARLALRDTDGVDLEHRVAVEHLATHRPRVERGEIGAVGVAGAGDREGVQPFLDVGGRRFAEGERMDVSDELPE